MKERDSLSSIFESKSTNLRTEKTAILGTHVAQEGHVVRAKTPTFALLRVCRTIYIYVGALLRSRIRTYVCTYVSGRPHVGRRHRHRRLSRWILERAEVRLQRTVHKTASLQNREIGRHGYLRAAFLRHGVDLWRAALLRGPRYRCRRRVGWRNSSLARAHTHAHTHTHTHTHIDHTNVHSLAERCYIRNQSRDHIQRR